MARPGDTPETLAARHLGDPKKKWMIEDYMGVRTFSDGQEIVIPKREWNPVGVYPWGYQLVPVLVYHNISAQDKGKLSIASRTFDAQIRQLHDEGFQAITLADFMAFTAGRRQLPRKSVLLTFDDGYKSFVQYARPILKDYGFGATLFVYSDFIGAGSGLSWQDLRTLSEQGYDVQAHSKSHANLRRKEGESEAAYAKRIEAELAYPLSLFKKHLPRPVDALAYPYGEMDDELIPFVAKYGYAVAFTVRRQSNPAFVSLLKISRAQIYSDMTAKDFTKNLVVFHDEEVKLARAADGRLAGTGGALQAQAASTPSATVVARPARRVTQRALRAAGEARTPAAGAGGARDRAHDCSRRPEGPGCAEAPGRPNHAGGRRPAAGGPNPARPRRARGGAAAVPHRAQPRSDEPDGVRDAPERGPRGDVHHPHGPGGRHVRVAGRAVLRRQASLRGHRRDESLCAERDVAGRAEDPGSRDPGRPVSPAVSQNAPR